MFCMPTLCFMGNLYRFLLLLVKVEFVFLDGEERQVEHGKNKAEGRMLRSGDMSYSNLPTQGGRPKILRVSE